MAEPSREEADDSSSGASGLPSNYLIGILCGIGAAVIWGGSSVVSRYLITTKFDALELTTLRYAACFPAALLIYAMFYPRLVSTVGWRSFATLILLAGPPFHFLVIAGYAFLPAGLGAVLLAGLLALFTTLGAPFFQGGTIRFVQLAALLLTVCGLMLIGLQLHSPFGNGWESVLAGCAIFGLAALLWTFLNHLVSAWQLDASTVTINLALCAPLFLPISAYGLDIGGLLSAGLGDLFLQLIYHGLFVALAATFLFLSAVRRLGAISAAIVLALAPALATIFGWLFLGETLSVISVVGVVLVLTGFLGAALLQHRPSAVASSDRSGKVGSNHD